MSRRPTEFASAIARTKPSDAGFSGSIPDVMSAVITFPSQRGQRILYEIRGPSLGAVHGETMLIRFWRTLITVNRD